jgi:hypothetical protein
MAVGLTLIFGVMRVVNFAHGDMMVWGMYLAWLLATRAGVDPYAGFLLCAALFLVGWLTQRLLADRIVDAPHEMQIHAGRGAGAGERRALGIRARSGACALAALGRRAVGRADLPRRGAPGHVRCGAAPYPSRCTCS